MRRYAAFVLLAASTVAHAACPTRLLVSGYLSNNVHVYDACSGEFERLLDDNHRIRGPQAVRIGPDGLLYVASEETNQILRYDAKTLAYVDAFVSEAQGFHPTAFSFGPDGDLYVAGFEVNRVNRYDAHTGQFKATVVAAGSQVRLNGPDNGMVFGPDGKLYIPGYYTHNILRYDPATGATVELVGARSGGLNHSRGILFEPGGASFVVSSEGSGQLLRYRSDGGFIGVLTAGLVLPTGMVYAADGTLWIAPGYDGVAVLDATTGAKQRDVFPPGAGGLRGETFVALIPNAAQTVDQSQIGTQFWTVGAGRVAGKSLSVDPMGSATGTNFGTAFDPATVTRKRWGSMRMDFTACDKGTVSWDSTGADSAGFGSGSYAIERVLPSTATAVCQQQGFANALGADWMSGHWWGGASRSGEGFLVDIATDGTAIVAWFTFRPVP